MWLKNKNIQNITSAIFATLRLCERKIFVNLCVFLVFLCVTTITTNAQVTTKTDTTKIRIGEQFNYQIEVKATIGVEFYKLRLDSLQKIEIIKSHKIDTLKDRLIRKFTLTSFDSGRYTLPKQLVRIFERPYFTDSLVIDVSTVAIDTIKQPIFPIKAIQHQDLNLKDYAKNYWWLLILVPIIGLAIWYFFIRKKETEEERVAKIPPFEMAVQQLVSLDKKLLWQNNKTKQYYSELTDIIRTFIEKELKLPALESTTNELVNTIKKANNLNNLEISKKTVLKLKDLLQEADLVKFAKSKPFANEIEMHRKYADIILEGLKSIEIEENVEILEGENTLNKDETESSKENSSSIQIDSKVDNSKFKNNTMGKKKKSPFDKKKIINTIIGMLAFFISYFAIQYFVFNKNSIDKKLIEVANEINKNCPITLDKETRLDNTLVLPNRTFQYNYTLVNIDKSVIDADELKNYLQPGILNTIKTNPDMKTLRDNKVNFVYRYVDKNNEFIFKIIIPSKMYIENAK